MLWRKIVDLMGGVHDAGPITLGIVDDGAFIAIRRKVTANFWGRFIVWESPGFSVKFKHHM